MDFQVRRPLRRTMDFQVRRPLAPYAFLASRIDGLGSPSYGILEVHEQFQHLDRCGNHA